MALSAVTKATLGPADRQFGGLLLLQGLLNGFAVGALADRDQFLQFVRPLRDEIVLQSVDQRTGDARRHRGDQIQPVGRQPGRQYRQGHNAHGAVHDLAKLAQELCVGERLGTDGVVDVRLAVVLAAQQPDQVVEQIVESDWLAARADPARREHQRQVIDEVADHFEGGRTGANDDPGS